MFCPLLPSLSVFFRFVLHYRTLVYSVCILTGWGISSVFAQPKEESGGLNFRPSSSSSASAVSVSDLRTAVKQIPWNDLPAAVQNRIRRVVSGSPVFRRLPQQTIFADPEIHQYLIQHPDIVVGLWERLGATQISLREIKENQYLLKEKSGTAAAVEVLYRTHEICILYAKGEYRGPLLAKSYQGEAVIILRTRLKHDVLHEPVIVCDLDAFVLIDSAGADLLAKLFYTSLGKIADGNFEVTVSFISRLSQTASRTPETVKQTVEEIETVRKDICGEFCEVLDRAAVRFAKRKNAALPDQTQNPQNPAISLYSPEMPNSETSEQRIHSGSDVFDTDPFFAQPFKKKNTPQPHLSNRTYPSAADETADWISPPAIRLSRLADADVPRLPPAPQ
jgi:hypothetical protein